MVCMIGWFSNQVPVGSPGYRLVLVGNHLELVGNHPELVDIQHHLVDIQIHSLVLDGNHPFVELVAYEPDMVVEQSRFVVVVGGCFCRHKVRNKHHKPSNRLVLNTSHHHC